MSAANKTVSSGKSLVLGLGATGLSIARYLRRNNDDAMFLDSRDEPPGMDELNSVWPGANVVLGEMKLPRNVGRVIVSPGIEDSHELLKKARKKKLEVVSDIEIFAREVQAPFVAVTGSNGKSTVTTLLFHMCRAAGREVLAGGNLGAPALDSKSLPAAVAVLLNVTPDHLDWHADETEYRQSKYRVYNEAHAAVVNRNDAEAARCAEGIERIITFGLDTPGDGQYGIRHDDDVAYLARGDKLLIAAADLAMFGSHNLANALAALATGELLEIEMPAMLQVLTEFPGLPHRMQFVARRYAVNYINDSKATNVAAAVASIESVDGSLVLVAGGDGKGGNFADLAAAVESKLRAAVLIGKDAAAIADALDTVMPVYFAQDMGDAVCQAAAYAESDDTVLLAPACASLDQYDDYKARGDAFSDAVLGLPR